MLTAQQIKCIENGWLYLFKHIQADYIAFHIYLMVRVFHASERRAPKESKARKRETKEEGRPEDKRRCDK